MFSNFDFYLNYLLNMIKDSINNHLLDFECFKQNIVY